MSGGTVAGMLTWMPISPGGFCAAILSDTTAPQSPPWET